MKTDDLTLDSKIIGALPIVNTFITLLVRSLLIERNPLYKISEWATAMIRI